MIGFKDWSVKYNQNEAAVPPKLDTNAPDMYIPGGYICYVNQL